MGVFGENRWFNVVTKIRMPSTCSWDTLIQLYMVVTEQSQSMHVSSHIIHHVPSLQNEPQKLWELFDSDLSLYIKENSMTLCYTFLSLSILSSRGL